MGIDIKGSYMYGSPGSGSLYLIIIRKNISHGPIL